MNLFSSRFDCRIKKIPFCFFSWTKKSFCWKRKFPDSFVFLTAESFVEDLLAFLSFTIAEETSIRWIFVFFRWSKKFISKEKWKTFFRRFSPRFALPLKWFSDRTFDAIDVKEKAKKFLVFARWSKKNYRNFDEIVSFSSFSEQNRTIGLAKSIDRSHHSVFYLSTVDVSRYKEFSSFFFQRRHWSSGNASFLRRNKSIIIFFDVK